MITTAASQSWGAHIRATLVLGFPLVGSHVAQMLTHVTDTVMLGWYGVDELAASALAASIFFIVFIVGSGFAFAVMPMVADADSRGDERQIRRTVRMGLWISGFYTAALVPILFVFEPMLIAMGQDPHISALATDYMLIAFWGLLPALVIMVFKSFLSALERPQIVLAATLGGAVLNVFINYALIFGNWGAPELGIRGAAWASIGTAMLSTLVLLVYVVATEQTQSYRLFDRFWRSDWPAFGEVFKLGWPIGGTMLAETGFFTASAIMMGWIGTIELATHGIALEIAAVSFMIHLGISNVATVRAGRAVGRGDVQGLRRVAISVVGVSLIVAVAVIVVYVTVPEWLIGMFLDADDPQAPAIVAYGVALLIVAAIFQFADAAQVLALGLLRGIKDTRVPMVLAAISYWGIGLPAGYILGFPMGYGGIGIWSGLVIGLTLAGVTLSLRYLFVSRQMFTPGSAVVGQSG